MENCRNSWRHELKLPGQASSYSRDDLILIGQLGKPHGLQGELRCRPETDFPERFLDTQYIEIFPDGGQVRQIEIENARFHGSLLLIKLYGVDTIEDASQLRNYWVAVPDDQVIALDDGYYHYQLEGLQVFEPDGTLIGILREVISNPAHEIYRVDDLLIPAVEHYIIHIDLDNKRIIARRPVFADED